MRFLVLGGGAQGSAAAFDLLREPGVEEVTVADRVTPHIPLYLRQYAGGNRFRHLELDAHDHEAVLTAMEGVSAVACALPYYLNESMAHLAVQAGVHYADLGGNTEIVERQRRDHEAAVEKGVSVIPDTGLAPGMVNILARAGMDALDVVESVRMWVGGLPQDPRPPLNYQIVYSLEGVLDYYTEPGIVLREGEPAQVEALSEVEALHFDGVGELEAFHTAGGASTLPERYRGKVQTLEYKTLRYPGHASIMRAIRELGLLDQELVRVGEVDVSPRQLFIARVSPLLHVPDGGDLVVLRVEVEGRREGEPVRTSFDLLDRHDDLIRMSAMSRCTGFSLSLTSLMQARGEVLAPGVLTPDEAIPVDPYVRGLARRGVRIQRSEAGVETPS
ncbi:MAG: saccharopine dehydrogenase C-terminal domain-containing protein [Gemmatimonadota bacterium]